MSIPASKKIWLAAAAIGVAVLLYVVASIGLTSFARHVEAAGLVHPYPDDDGLRYITPSLFGSDREGRIMLIGPSSVREALLYDRFDEAFPDKATLVGALSMGTFEDQLLALEIVEREQGGEVLPSVMVLGLSPRFVADLPRGRNFADRINRFSRRFSIVGDEGDLRLEPRSALGGALTEVRFRTQMQVGRYQSAVWGRIAADATARKPGQGPGRFQRFLLSSRLAQWLGIGMLLEVGLKRYATFQAAPYRWHGTGRPITTPEDLLARLTDNPGYWSLVYEWNPAADSARVFDSFERMNALADRLGIELFYVDMPEHAVAQGFYAPGARDTYSALIRQGAADTPLLDLHDFVGEHEFYDPVHPSHPAARLVTDSVISFIKLARCAPAGDRSGEPCPSAP